VIALILMDEFGVDSFGKLAFVLPARQQYNNARDIPSGWASAPRTTLVFNFTIFMAPAALSAAPQAPLPPSILLVDDHALFRAGMRFILADGELAASTVLQAGSLTEALSLPDSVDVVLLDVQMPGINGMEGLTLIKRRWPKAAVLMLSAHEDAETQQQCMQRGALAFVSKTASPEQIRAVVAQAACGLLQPIAQASELHENGEESGQASSQLSARQLDVLLLMCEGISNKAIARKLFVSENTVRSHVAAVLKHFGSSTRVEAVIAAQKNGMVSVRANSLSVAAHAVHS
jgi:DNA-binding NarL/FixJ family response regulator